MTYSFDFSETKAEESYETATFYHQNSFFKHLFYATWKTLEHLSKEELNRKMDITLNDKGGLINKTAIILS